MSWGLAGAFAAAIAYGGATILQAQGAGRQGAVDDLDAQLIVRLLRSTPYVAGVALDAIGFALSFVALRSEPLFVVQAIVASSLAVTALLSVAVLGTRPRAVEWVALVSVTTGLTLLALSARHEPPARLDQTDRLLFLSLVIAVGLISAAIARGRGSSRPKDAWAFGFMAGLMYGSAGIAARVLRPSHHLSSVVTDPALWTLISAGLLGLLLYAMALQRGSITIATSTTTVADTLVPAAIGVFLLGDRPAQGRTGVAIAGFILALAGAVALARYGEAPTAAIASAPGRLDARAAEL